MSVNTLPSEIRARLGTSARPVAEDMFTYRAHAENLGAGGVQTFGLQVEADSYFVITKMSYMASIGGNIQTASTRVLPLVRCLITDTGSGRALMSEPVDITALAGSEGLPFLTPAARWILPNSSVNIQFISYAAAQVYSDVSLYLHGKKVWF